MIIALRKAIVLEVVAKAHSLKNIHKSGRLNCIDALHLKTKNLSTAEECDSIPQRLTTRAELGSGRLALCYHRALKPSHYISLVGWLKFLAFFHLYKRKLNPMNYAKPVGRSRAVNCNPVRLMAIGQRQDVQHLIDQLCKLGFCDYVDWSKLQPHPDHSGDYLSIMTQWRSRD